MASRLSFRSLASIHGLLAALVVAVLIAVAAPATAQQVNPTTSAVKEEQLLQQLRQIDGRVSIPDAKAGVLLQPGGDWRTVHNSTLPLVTGVALLGMLAVLVIYFMTRGKIMIDAGLSGLKILRFNGFERFVHWLTASCFIVLAISGLNVTFGKRLLLPLIGPEAFTAFSQFAKYAHNYLAFPFMVGLVLMFLVWVVDNIPNGRDVAWFKAGGGLLGKGHPPAGKFNGGQKMIFWSVILGGAALSFTGVILLFPVSSGHVDRRRPACADRACRRRRVAHGRDARPHLHRLGRHAGRVRCHGLRRGRCELGEGAPLALGRGDQGEGQRPPRCPGRINKSVGFRSWTPGSLSRAFSVRRIEHARHRARRMERGGEDHAPRAPDPGAAGAGLSVSTLKHAHHAFDVDRPGKDFPRPS